MSSRLFPLTLVIGCAVTLCFLSTVFATGELVDGTMQLKSSLDADDTMLALSRENRNFIPEPGVMRTELRYNRARKAHRKINKRRLAARKLRRSRDATRHARLVHQSVLKRRSPRRQSRKVQRRRRIPRRKRRTTRRKRRISKNKRGQRRRRALVRRRRLTPSRRRMLRRRTARRKNYLRRRRGARRRVIRRKVARRKVGRRRVIRRKVGRLRVGRPRQPTRIRQLRRAVRKSARKAMRKPIRHVNVEPKKRGLDKHPFDPEPFSYGRLGTSKLKPRHPFHPDYHNTIQLMKTTKNIRKEIQLSKERERLFKKWKKIAKNGMSDPLPLPTDRIPRPAYLMDAKDSPLDMMAKSLGMGGNSAMFVPVGGKSPQEMLRDVNAYVFKSPDGTVPDKDGPPL